MITDIDFIMNNRANNKVQDMVQFIGNEHIPVFRLKIYSFLLPILATFDRLYIPKNELHESMYKLVSRECLESM
jgi:hypothetical protein